MLADHSVLLADCAAVGQSQTSGSGTKFASSSAEAQFPLIRAFTTTIIGKLGPGSRRKSTNWGRSVSWSVSERPAYLVLALGAGCKGGGKLAGEFAAAWMGRHEPSRAAHYGSGKFPPCNGERQKRRVVIPVFPDRSCDPLRTCRVSVWEPPGSSQHNHHGRTDCSGWFETDMHPTRRNTSHPKVYFVSNEGLTLERFANRSGEAGRTAAAGLPDSSV